MTVVVAGLAEWLVGLLREAARKGLISLVFGTELERALWDVTKAAVSGTATELRPDGGEPAAERERVIGQVVRARVPRELDLTAGRTLLPAISSGVAAQAAVLDDRDLTEQGVSSADILGVPARVIGERLTEHLSAGIRSAGLGGGPLKPLADQLNSDLTHKHLHEIRQRLPAPADTATDEEFAADLQALLEALLEQAEQEHALEQA